MPKVKKCSDGKLMFWCPGCEEHHGISVDGSRGWQWNGSVDLPTVTPSIFVRSHDAIVNGTRIPCFKYDGPYPVERAESICHSYIGSHDGSTPGYIEFLGDCTHSKAGQTVELSDIDSV
jgi:hypothetical protein